MIGLLLFAVHMHSIGAVKVSHEYINLLQPFLKYRAPKILLQGLMRHPLFQCNSSLCTSHLCTFHLRISHQRTLFSRYVYTGNTGFIVEHLYYWRVKAKMSVQPLGGLIIIHITHKKRE